MSALPGYALLNHDVTDGDIKRHGDEKMKCYHSLIGLLALPTIFLAVASAEAVAQTDGACRRTAEDAHTGGNDFSDFWQAYDKCRGIQSAPEGLTAIFARNASPGGSVSPQSVERLLSYAEELGLQTQIIESPQISVIRNEEVLEVETTVLPWEQFEIENLKDAEISIQGME